MSRAELVPCSQEDFLEQDKEIRGQNYVCLSFLSPEEVLKKKELFVFDKFKEAFSSDVLKLFAHLKEKFPKEEDGINALQDLHSYMFSSEMLQERWLEFSSNPELEKKFSEANNFQTSIRGIKVRGVYETLREAQVRSEVLKRTDSRHNIYIAQVGCWCPWSPNPDDIQDQEYAESGLNTLMKEYQKNQQQKDTFYEERARELKELASRKTNLIKEEVKTQALEEAPTGTSVESSETPTTTDEPATASETASSLGAEDPWLASKKNTSTA